MSVPQIKLINMAVIQDILLKLSLENVDFKKINFNKKCYFCGDHLGPLPWKKNKKIALKNLIKLDDF